MYILKTKGTTKVPDYIQLRDENFVLVAHFNAKNYKKNIAQLSVENKDVIANVIEALPFGELKKIEI